jgi:N4-gp56 family major capsid protein
MATNTQGQFTADIEAFIAEEVLPLAQRQLVAYQFGDPLELPKGRGLQYTATRFNRLPLPFAPLSEDVPPLGASMSIQQVTATVQQWGDQVIITDVAELTIKHPLMKQANFLIGLEIAELLERNTYNALMAGTQVNYVNSRGARASLTATDVLDPHTVNRTVVALKDNGAYMFLGNEQTDVKIDADAGGSQARASADPKGMPHFVAIANPNVLGDFSENSTVVNAWSYSDINRLYNAEVGVWRGMRFCESNMVPSFVGVAAINGTGVTTGGSLPGAANYYVQVTASDTQNQYESRIYQVSAAITDITTGSTNSITVTLPALTGFTFNVYVGTTSSPSNLGLCSAGPTSGPMAGQAVQLAGNQTVTITGLGAAQTPPAAPATGVTVYPTFVIGKGAYGQVKLDDIKTSWLDKADKSDPLNQSRRIGWKIFYGSILLNTQFMARIESSSAFSATYG